jgi:hypothetical protein
MTLENRIAYRKFVEDMLEEAWNEAEDDDERTGCLNGCLAFIQKHGPDRLGSQQPAASESKKRVDDKSDQERLDLLKDSLDSATLTEWEVNFSDSILGQDYPLTERQKEIVDQIILKAERQLEHED